MYKSEFKLHNVQDLFRLALDTTIYSFECILEGILQKSQLKFGGPMAGIKPREKTYL